MRKHKLKLKLNHETIKILAGPALERVVGGTLLLCTIVGPGDSGPSCNPPQHTNSISPCCASIHKVCPVE